VIKIAQAIKAINPDAEFSIEGEDYTKIIWFNDTTPINEADIQAKQNELQTEYDALDYARKREAEYPTIEELVVALYDSEDKTAVDEKRAEIKLKYPKPVA